MVAVLSCACGRPAVLDAHCRLLRVSPQVITTTNGMRTTAMRGAVLVAHTCIAQDGEVTAVKPYRSATARTSVVYGTAEYPCAPCSRRFES